MMQQLREKKNCKSRVYWDIANLDHADCIKLDKIQRPNYIAGILFIIWPCCPLTSRKVNFRIKHCSSLLYKLQKRHCMKEMCAIIVGR